MNKTHAVVAFSALAGVVVAIVAWEALGIGNSASRAPASHSASVEAPHAEPIAPSAPALPVPHDAAIADAVSERVRQDVAAATLRNPEELAVRAGAVISNVVAADAGALLESCVVMGGTMPPGMEEHIRAYYRAMPEERRPPGLDAMPLRDLVNYSLKDASALQMFEPKTVRATSVGKNANYFGMGVVSSQTPASRTHRALLRTNGSSVTSFTCTPQGFDKEMADSPPDVVVVEFLGRDAKGTTALYAIGFVDVPGCGWFPMYMGVSGGGEFLVR